MTADEARALLAGMTPGTLSVERAAGIRRLAVPQGDELALVIRDSPREFGGAMYSLEVCRGMDGPTREANAAAFAAVKRALATVAATAPDDTRAQAGECDVAAIGARAAAYESAAQAYATADHGAPSRIARLEMEDAAHESAADVPALLAELARLRAHAAGEGERVAAAVAGETQRCNGLLAAVRAECNDLFTAARGTLATPALASMQALHRLGGCWLVSYDDDETGDPITTIEYLDGARALAEKEGDNPVRWVAVDRHGHACIPPRGSALDAPAQGDG